MPSPEAPLTGSCACGTVRFHVTREFKTAGYCHCTRCQRRAGVPWSMNGVVDDAGFAAAGRHRVGALLAPARRDAEGVLRDLRRACVLGRSGRGRGRSACASAPCTGTRGSRRGGASGWNPRRTGSRSRTTDCRVSRKTADLRWSGANLVRRALVRCWRRSVAHLGADRARRRRRNAGRGPRAGINFLETARYHDAPGLSEAVFGEIFWASGWRRDEVTIANRLRCMFWPEQSVGKRSMRRRNAPGTSTSM